MKWIRKMIPLLLAVCMVCAMSTTVNAVNYALPDPKQTGSLDVAVSIGGKPLSGGTLYLYQIASVSVTENTWSYVYTDAFADCGVTLGSTQAENLTKEKASAWSDYAAKKKLSGQSLTVGKDGTVSASGLELGLYLVCQGTAASGYTMSPTVVPIPLEEESGMNYQVKAVPKITGKTPVNTPTTPTNTPTKTNPPTSSTLPKTGQLWWPVSLLAIGGIVLYALGWNENRKSKS